MGKQVFASQFAARLIPDIKAKVVGSEGDLDIPLAYGSDGRSFFVEYS